MKICIDAGHGGKDAGAVGKKSKEKDINLKVGLKLGEILKNSGQEVIYTRTSDVFVELEDRVKISNNAKADVFVSIHCNAATNNTAKGTETFYCKGSTRGKNIAAYVQNELLRLGLINRGVKSAGYYVIKYTKAPAILVELAFISNVDEENMLNNEDMQYKMALAIAKGLGQALKFEVKQTKKWQVLASALNIRKGPSTKFAVVGTYKKGDKIIILEKNGEWGRTDKGWINMNYVTLL